MNLLVVTQVVDTKDPILGFFHDWIVSLASRCEKVHVICLKEGEHRLPKNVFIHSLGKEKGGYRIQYIVRLYTYAWQLRNEYDAVFVHMSPEYLVVLGWLWRLMGKRIGMWYVHTADTLYLRLATLFSHVILTVSKNTFPFSDTRCVYTGHGIDTETFSPAREGPKDFHVVTIGRIGPSKNTRTICEGVLIARNARTDIHLSIYGVSVTPEEKKYRYDLEEWLQGLDARKMITIGGSLEHQDVPSRLRNASVFVNMGTTGGIDKAVLEAMAVGIPVISSSRAHESVLHPVDKRLIIHHTKESLAEALLMLHAMTPEARLGLGVRLRKIVVTEHSLSGLVKKIIWNLSQNK